MILIPSYRSVGHLRGAAVPRLICFLALLTLALTPRNTYGAPRRGCGLTVDAAGVLRKDGKPYRGIGVNYFNAFFRTMLNPNDTGYEAGFQALEEAQIPFCRIMAGGFWPKEQKLYRDDKKEFFRRFDAVVHSAEKHNVGLILSCFWNTSTVPDLVGEPISAWGDRNSKSRACMREYVKDLALHYRASPALWGWEFGNEYNLSADLPNAAEQRPPVAPDLGTPPVRTQKDEITYAALHAAFLDFAREVRKYDPHRIIETGDSMPRESAWHNWKEKKWTHDTPEQQAELLDHTNPEPVDVISVHFYKETGEQLRGIAQYARKRKKPLFVGEFGAEGSPEQSEEAFRTILKAIEQANVPLAALWVFDYDDQDKVWNVTQSSERAYQLEAVSEANRRIQAGL